MTKLQRQLSTTGNKEMAESFEDVLSALTDQSHRDPKTTLLQFPWFMDRLERFLGYERRHQWCAVGLVDIANFKWYNDTVGHLVGDRIIERVAHILAEQIRSDDLLSGDCQTPDYPGEQDLHARFGGDEFSFLIPDVFSFNEACGIAQRFKSVVERHDWAAEHEALAQRPVVVDVGMVCVQLGPLPERQSHAGHVAAELVQRADQLMYAAKNEHASTVRALALRVHNGELTELFGWESAARADDPTEPHPTPRICRRFTGIPSWTASQVGAVLTWLPRWPLEPRGFSGTRCLAAAFSCPAARHSPRESSSLSTTRGITSCRGLEFLE